MILQSLVQYYEALERRGEITRPGWCRAKVSFALELSHDGDLLRILPLTTETKKGKKTVSESCLLRFPRWSPDLPVYQLIFYVIIPDISCGLITKEILNGRKIAFSVQRKNT